ncbi:methyl-accepting chemotaxis protein [Chitinivorax tropicus]|uniref:Methyl-accepting chemotaxis protein n=1 Tax=Chitinivorax tropicus TaxID=714531 RepID=A0A840MQQ0_9PROT|nr:methyl-accepting chemotaxis protein [Chitinivorax tropicus]MBB5018776.1 methyl-accepting chemotaxis protein [Chitinivorax tropicus]
MWGLLRPAASLASHLKFGAKFMLVGAVLGVPLVMLAGTLALELLNDVRQIDQAQQGVEVNQSLSHLLIQVQKHRGMTNGFLSGDTTFGPRIEENEAALEKNGVDLTRLANSTGYQREITAILSEWRSVHQQWRQAEIQQNFQAHTTLISNVLKTMMQMTDASGLKANRDPQVYYLQRLAYEDLILLGERLALARGMGTGIASRKQITLDERMKMATHVGIARHLLAGTQLQLALAFGNEPALQAVLGDQSGRLLARIGQAVQNVESQLVMAEQIQTEPAAYFEMTSAAIDEVYQLFKVIGGELATVLAAQDVSSHRMIITISGLMIALALLVSWLFLGTYRSLQEGVSELGRVSAALSTGDLTVTARITGRDEFQQIGVAVNSVAMSWRELIGQLNHAAGQVAQAVTELNDSAEQIATSSIQQSHAAASMASSVQQMTVSIAQVADSTSDVDRQAEATQHQSVQMERVVHGAVGEIIQIEQSVNETARTIGELRESATEISNIVGVIKDIADQTNLLALNAAIESARAGEAGRGFAVVADEVRTLAARTSEATQQIERMIQDVQRKTYRAVDVMQAGHQRVGNGVQLVRNVGDAVEEIRRTISQAKSMIDDITCSTTEQRAASTLIAQNVEKVAQMAEQNAAAVQSTLHVSQRLHDEANGLQQSLRAFKL